MRACAPRSAICSDSAAMRWRRCTTRDFAAARITRSPRCVAPRVVSSVSLDLDFSNIRRLGVARPDHPGQMRADPEKSQMGSSARAACPMLTVRPDVRRVGRSEDTRWAERSLSKYVAKSFFTNSATRSPPTGCLPCGVPPGCSSRGPIVRPGRHAHRRWTIASWPRHPS